MLTLEIARATAKKIVEERGNTVYNPGGLNQCFYAPLDVVINHPKATQVFKSFAQDVKDRIESGTRVSPANETGCLVGEILKENNLLSDNLIAKGGPISEYNYWFDENLRLDTVVVTYLSLLQEKQDSGATWQDAFTYANLHIEDRIKEKKNA